MIANGVHLGKTSTLTGNKGTNCGGSLNGNRVAGKVVDYTKCLNLGFSTGTFTIPAYTQTADVFISRWNSNGELTCLIFDLFFHAYGYGCSQPDTVLLDTRSQSVVDEPSVTFALCLYFTL